MLQMFLVPQIEDDDLQKNVILQEKCAPKM
jgi:hypothetical protein